MIRCVAGAPPAASLAAPAAAVKRPRLQGLLGSLQVLVDRLQPHEICTMASLAMAMAGLPSLENMKRSKSLGNKWFAELHHPPGDYQHLLLTAEILEFLSATVSYTSMGQGHS